MSKNQSLALEFPGVSAGVNAEVIQLQSEQPLYILSSAVVGGGLTRARVIINRHVDKNYNHPDPSQDLQDFAAGCGIAEPFVGLMTAAYLDGVKVVTLAEKALTVSAVITAGFSNPTAAGLSLPAVLTPNGFTSATINMIFLIDAHLTPAAMVNAVITATEAKTDVLRQQNIATPAGYPATGTSTDAIVVGCTGRGEPLPYAGPATEVGWLIGRCVRAGLDGN